MNELVFEKTKPPQIKLIMTFRFFIGGFSSDYFEVLLKGGCLYVFLSLYLDTGSAYQRPDYILNVEEDKEWMEFVAFMETLH